MMNWVIYLFYCNIDYTELIYCIGIIYPILIHHISDVTVIIHRHHIKSGVYNELHSQRIALD